MHNVIIWVGKERDKSGPNPERETCLNERFWLHDGLGDRHEGNTLEHTGWPPPEAASGQLYVAMDIGCPSLQVGSHEEGRGMERQWDGDKSGSGLGRGQV